LFNPTSNRFIYLLKHTILWLFFFISARILFGLYHHAFQIIEVKDFFYSILYGFRLDASIIGYSLFPLGILTAIGLIHPKIYKWANQSYNIFFYLWIAIITFGIVADLELFTYWGFRLDNSALRYSNTPEVMVATVMSAPLLLLISLYITIVVGFIFLFHVLKLHHWPKYPSYVWVKIPIILFFTASLIIPIRGGLQQIPINESVVYFSNEPFANQLAINPIWSFGRSVIEGKEVNLARYQFEGSMPYIYSNNKSIDTLTNQSKPNVIFIVWESFTNKIFKDSITPYAVELAKNGYLFSNAYASGDRSDKGLVALLSGYSSQPDYSIMTDPSKSRKLNYLPQAFKQKGYQSAYVYGGELNFANMRSYMSYAGFDQIIGKENFPEETWDAKWGASDRYTFDKTFTVAQSYHQKKQPFFITLFTLSSHEPFDVPNQGSFKGTALEQKFKNAHKYTDNCLKQFVEKAKKESWWDNTIIVIVADHGHVLPGSEYAWHKASEFHIPLIFTGGALRKKGVQNNVFSQTHLASYLSKELKLNGNYPFAQQPTSKYALYAFNDGFGIAQNDTSFLLYDLNQRAISYKSKHVDTTLLPLAQGYIQSLMLDFSKK
jgi:phosphoglycerol transferase MdoB-like AlkP superfamily enzyme